MRRGPDLSAKSQRLRQKPADRSGGQNRVKVVWAERLGVDLALLLAPYNLSESVAVGVDVLGAHRQDFLHGVVVWRKRRLGDDPQERLALAAQVVDQPDVDLL